MPGNVLKPSNLNTLIVDSNSDRRSGLKALLRNSGFNFVMEIGKAEYMKEILGKKQIDLIFFDDDADYDPFSIGKKLRDNPDTKKIKTILTTSGIDHLQTQGALESGLDAILERPLKPNALEVAVRTAFKRTSVDYKDVIARLKAVEFLKDFKDEELVKLLKIARTSRFNEGDIIFREGDPGDRFYIILQGEVGIVKIENGQKKTLATLAGGTCFGEMAILDSEPRSANAVAKTPALMMEMDARVLNNSNEIYVLKLFRRLAVTMTQRLRETNVRLMHSAD